MGSLQFQHSVRSTSIPVFAPSLFLRASFFLGWIPQADRRDGRNIHRPTGGLLLQTAQLATVAPAAQPSRVPDLPVRVLERSFVP